MQMAGQSNFARVQMKRWRLWWRSGDNWLSGLRSVQAGLLLLPSGLDHRADRRLSGRIQRSHHISVLLVGVAAVLQKIYDAAC